MGPIRGSETSRPTAGDCWALVTPYHPIVPDRYCICGAAVRRGTPLLMHAARDAHAPLPADDEQSWSTQLRSGSGTSLPGEAAITKKDLSGVLGRLAGVPRAQQTPEPPAAEAPLVSAATAPAKDAGEVAGGSQQEARGGRRSRRPPALSIAAIGHQAASCKPELPTPSHAAGNSGNSSGRGQSLSASPPSSRANVGLVGLIGDMHGGTCGGHTADSARFCSWDTHLVLRVFLFESMMMCTCLNVRQSVCVCVCVCVCLVYRC